MQSTGLRDVYDWVSGRGRMGLDGGGVGREQDILRKFLGKYAVAGRKSLGKIRRRNLAWPAEKFIA